MSQDVTTMTANGTLPVSRRDRERWSPPDAPDRVYVLAPLTIRERAQVVREVTASVGLMPSEIETRETVREAALAQLEPDEAATVVRALDELAGLDQAGDHDDPEVQQALATLRATVERWQARLSRRDPRVRELLAARSSWLDAWIDCTARASIREWEGLPAPCVRRGGFVTAEAMLAVPDEDLGPLFARCQEWQEVSRDQEQGSASP